MTASGLFGRRDPSLAEQLYRRYERIGVLCLITGVITVFGLFTLIRVGSEFNVILTFLIVGVILIVMGVVLLALSRGMFTNLRSSEDSECLSEEQGCEDEKPPAYETVVKVKYDSLPGYQESLKYIVSVK